MVAIVSGNGLGLSLGSMASLGSRGAWGSANQGRSGEQAYVNASTGNLVLRDQDDLLAGRGLDSLALRTYNSMGRQNDDNGDNWSTGIYAQQLRLVGARNAVGSAIVRTDRDGGEASYAFDADRGVYVSTAGSGAYDTVAYDSATSQYAWIDGDTGAEERYDSVNGKLLKSRDSSGNTLSYTYNGNLLASVSTASGETTYYDYSGNNLSQVRTVTVNAGVSQTQTRVHYGYDASNRLSAVTIDLSPADNSITDANVYTSAYTYDGASQRVASVAQTDGTKVAFTYVQVGTESRVETATDALGNVTRFSYDTAARRTTVVDPMGLRTQFDYDAQGQIVKVTAPSITGVSETTTFVYSATGDLTQSVDAEAHTIDMAYDASGNQIFQRDSAGNTVTRSFDARNQLQTETTYVVPDPDGSDPASAGQPLTSRNVYDAAGKNQLRFTLSADGRVTQFIYNAYGQRTSSIAYGAATYDISALAPTTTLTEAQLVAWVGTQDLTQSMRADTAYDVHGRVQKTTSYGTVDASGNGVADAGRSITQYVYDQAGLLLKTISALNGTTQYTYDGLGRRLTALDASSQLTVTQYDDAGARTAITLANGLTTVTTFDRAGRPISVQQRSAVYANLGQTAYFYDADSRLRMTQDATGVRQWMYYDEIGRKVGDVDAAGMLTEYAYDKTDCLTRTVVHTVAVDTVALVDESGRPKELTLSSIRPVPNGDDQTAWRLYDLAGRLVKTVDASGAVTELAYDGASRLVRTTAYATRVAAVNLGAAPTLASIAPPPNAADRVTRTFFNGDGLLIATLDGEGGLTENQYDGAARLVLVLCHATAAPAALQVAGTLAQLRPASNRGDQRTVYLYNDKGQVAGVVDAENNLTETVYDGDGNVTRTIRYTTQLAGIVVPTAELASLRPASSAEDQVSTWVYDKLDRIVQSTTAEGTQSRFVYDSAGHLVSSSQGFGTTDVRTLNARFDIQGRLVGALTAEGGALLTGSLTQDQIDAIWAQYGVATTYDAAGRRVSETDQNGHRTLFYYDVDGRQTRTVSALGEVSERQYNVLGQLVSTRQYGSRIALTGLAGGLEDATFSAALASIRNAQLDSTQTYTYYTTGTQASSTDALGNTTTMAYDAFGETISETAPLSSGTTRTDTSTYDRRGLRTGTTADAGGIAATSAAAYDAFGRLVSSTDANLNVRRQVFDRVGRVVQTIDRSAAFRSTAYDAFGRVLTQTDADHQTTTYSYSTSGRSVTVTTPEGIAATTVHTRFGQTYSVKDGKGQITIFTYDRDGNLKSSKTPLTITSQSFDKSDRLIETVDARGVRVDYTYDAGDRILTRTLDPAGLALTTAFAYDAKGEQISVTNPSGTVTTTRFDLGGNRGGTGDRPGRLGIAYRMDVRPPREGADDDRPGRHGQPVQLRQAGAPHERTNRSDGPGHQAELHLRQQWRGRGGHRRGRRGYTIRPRRNGSRHMARRSGRRRRAHRFRCGRTGPANRRVRVAHCRRGAALGCDGSADPVSRRRIAGKGCHRRPSLRPQWPAAVHGGWHGRGAGDPLRRQRQRHGQHRIRRCGRSGRVGRQQRPCRHARRDAGSPSPHGVRPTRSRRLQRRRRRRRHAIRVRREWQRDEDRCPRHARRRRSVAQHGRGERRRSDFDLRVRHGEP